MDTGQLTRHDQSEQFKLNSILFIRLKIKMEIYKNVWPFENNSHTFTIQLQFLSNPLTLTFNQSALASITPPQSAEILKNFRISIFSKNCFLRWWYLMIWQPFHNDDRPVHRDICIFDIWGLGNLMFPWIRRIYILYYWDMYLNVCYYMI